MRLSALIGLVLSLVSVAALAKDASPDSVKGLYLATDFPALTIRAGEEADLPLTIYNYGLPPQRTALTVADAPPGWKAEIEGSGKPVGAAFVDYDGKATLTLKLTIPETEKPGAYQLTLNAEGDTAKSSLPIAVTLAPPLAAKLTATPKFPMLSGAARSSFDFAVTVKNEGANDMTVVLKTDAPEGYTESYKEQYGTQDITSLLIKAGESKDITVSVKPNPSAPSGQVPVTFEAIGDKVSASATADARHRRPAGDDDQRPRRPPERRGLRRPGALDPADDRQYRLGAGGRRRHERDAAAGLEGRVRSQAGADHSGRRPAEGQRAADARRPGDRRRLSAQHQRRRRRRRSERQLSRHRADLDAVGRRRHRRHPHRAAGAGGRGRPVRPAMSEPIIRAEALTKRYGSALAVDGLDLTVEAGEVFGLLGPNGAGKTTTILMLLGLTEPTSGRAIVAGFDPLRQPLEVKRRVGYMPDSVGFYDHLSGVANLRYSAALCGMKPADADARIDAALKRVRLEAAGGKPVRGYSRGMRQRLAIAEILMKGAAIAILDEPTGGLDPQSTREFLELIHSLKQEGMTILLSSHLLDLVQSICDRVALFHRGRIGLTGRVDDLLSDVLGGTQVIRIEARGPGLADAIGRVAGVKRVSEAANGFRVEASGDARAAVARAIVEAGGELMSIEAGHASLEEVYTRYFEGVRDAA